jgi:hypothetical protein
MKGTPATISPHYSMSRADLVCLNEWLENTMSKGYIGQSSSPFAAHIDFAKKPDWGLQFCIDCHDIGSQTIYNQYALPLLQTPLNGLQEANICTKCDIQGGGNFLRVKEEDEYKLALQTRDGLFEPADIEFRTTQAPAASQGYINNTIREALHDFASGDWDNILTYSNSEVEHVEYVKWIIQ